MGDASMYVNESPCCGQRFREVDSIKEADLKYSKDTKK